MFYGPGVVKLWHAQTGKEVGALRAEAGPVEALAFSPDGRWLATGHLDSRVTLWDVAARKERARLDAHEQPVRAVRFAPDGGTLATASGLLKTSEEPGELKLWGVAGGRQRHRWKSPAGPVTTLAFSPDGTAWPPPARPTRYGGTRPRAGSAPRWGGEKAGAVPVAFSPDGQTLATGGLTSALHPWNATTGKEKAQLRGHCRTALLSRPPPPRTARPWPRWAWTTRCGFGTWPRGKSGPCWRGRARGPLCVAYSPDGKALAVGRADGTASLMDVGELLGRQPARKPEWATLWADLTSVRRAAYAPDGAWLATGGDKTAVLWEAATRKRLATYGVYADLVTAVAFSPDGRTRVTASLDGVVKLWDVAQAPAKPNP